MLLVKPHHTKPRRRIQNEFFAFDELDLAILEFAHPDFRSLQIGHDGDLATASGSSITHHLRPRNMIFCGAVREIEPHDIDPGPQHALQGADTDRH